MRDDRWQNLVKSAFWLDEQRADGDGQPLTLELRAQRIRAVLENVLEVFPSQLDPVEDFEAFAVRRFVLSLHRGLFEP
jgi:hypothetical protein